MATWWLCFSTRRPRSRPSRSTMQPSSEEAPVFLLARGSCYVLSFPFGWLHAYWCVCTHVCMYVGTNAYAYVCMCVCMYVCMSCRVRTQCLYLLSVLKRSCLSRYVFLRCVLRSSAIVAVAVTVSRPRPSRRRLLLNTLCRDGCHWASMPFGCRRRSRSLGNSG